MKKIGLISDTHGFLHPKLFDFLKDVDEIWHAGDIGNLTTLDEIRKFKPTRAVFGNIDNHATRQECKEMMLFRCEEVIVLMTHIGGYPKRYAKGIKPILIKHKPKLFISGHSHILKVINDPEFNLLHINPGAAGKSGIHQQITMTRFVIDKNTIKDLEILDIKREQLT